MGSSGSAAVYCLKKFKENYLRDKKQIDEELHDEYDIKIDLGDISNMTIKEIGNKLFGDEWEYYIKFFNESLILYGSTYDNDEWSDQMNMLTVVGAEIASTTIY